MRWNWRERCLGLAMTLAILGFVYSTAESADQAASRVSLGMTVQEVQDAVGYAEGISPYQVYVHIFGSSGPNPDWSEHSKLVRNSQQRYRSYELPIGSVLVLFQGAEGEEVAINVTTYRKAEESHDRLRVHNKKDTWSIEGILSGEIGAKEWKELKQFCKKRYTILHVCIATVLGLLTTDIARRYRLRSTPMKA